MQRVLKRVAWAYVAVGLLAALAYPALTPTERSILTLVVMASFLPACVVALSQHGFPRSFLSSALAIAALYLLSAVLLDVSTSSFCRLDTSDSAHDILL